MAGACLLAGCAGGNGGVPDGPYVVVLGTAQDGGFPQIASDHDRARAARRDPSRRRLVAALLIVDPRRQQRWLIDATPDIREQVERARTHSTERKLEGTRPPLFEGVFLTHAHMGHYTGLMQLGREAYGARGQVVYCSERMQAFLEGNAPWDLLVRLGNVEISSFRADEPVTLAPGLTITPVAVPHRGEYTDTFGFLVRGPSRSLLYIPDIDKWERWDRPVEGLIREVDVALLDGTFFRNGEIPGRDMSEISHPFIEESLQRFAALPPEERAKVAFIHLNHTNPAVEPDGEAQRHIGAAGMSVAAEGQVFGL